MIHEEIYINNVELDINDFIEEDKIKDATILSCGKYGITTEQYYEIANKLMKRLIL